MRALLLALIVAAPPAGADILLATTTIRAQSLIGPGDIDIAKGEAAGLAASPDDVVGKEARVTIYAGRPIRLADLGAPALVDRNQLVTLVFRQGVLSMTADGRALDRAGAGETVRAMNLGSRNVVTGRVAADGSILVSGTYR